jgi:ubiquinol-cytochrome c reductase cytochrome b subunit
VDSNQSAPDLAGFASRAWLEGLLDYDHYVSTKYFGGTAFKDGTMATKVLKKFGEKEKALVPKVAALLSDIAGLPYQEPLSEKEREEGFNVFFDELGCIDCHDIEDEDEGSAPDLTGYGSRDWLAAIVSDPSHERFYGKDNDRMPSFVRDEKLTVEEIGILVDWLRSKSSADSAVR